MLCFQLILFDKIILHFFVKTTGISWWVTGAVEFFEPSFNSPWTRIFHGSIIQGYSWQKFIIIIKTSDQTLGISIEESSIYDATKFCCQLGGKRYSKDELILNLWWFTQVSAAIINFDDTKNTPMP